MKVHLLRIAIPLIGVACLCLVASCGTSETITRHQTRILTPYSQLNSKLNPEKKSLLGETSRKQKNDNIGFTSENLDERTSLGLTPTVCDLKISEERISYTKVYEEYVETSLYSSLVNELVKEVSCEAAAINKADVIVAVTPSIEIQKIKGREKSKITITITGYPANYKNFRNATLEDAWIFYPDEYFRPNDSIRIFKEKSIIVN